MKIPLPARLRSTALIAAVSLAVAFAWADIITLQVTIGASANTPVSKSGAVYCKWIEFQNNSADSMRIGDSSTSSTRGLLLQPGTSFMEPPLQQPNVYNLSNWYVAGTSSDVLDVACESQ